METDYKLNAALAAVKRIRPGQTVGLGAGRTIAHLAKAIAETTELAETVLLTTSSAATTALLQQHPSLKTAGLQELGTLDIYFDSCDQLDRSLNALKSGAGIHATEKIAAAMAREFILLADAEKLVNRLDNKFPLAIELMPAALLLITGYIQGQFPGCKIIPRSGDDHTAPAANPAGNYLIDVFFGQTPDWDRVNELKIFPGIVDHSLFLGKATGAIISGPNGLEEL